MKLKTRNLWLLLKECIFGRWDECFIPSDWKDAGNRISHSSYSNPNLKFKNGIFVSALWIIHFSQIEGMVKYFGPKISKMLFEAKSNKERKLIAIKYIKQKKK